MKLNRLIIAVMIAVIMVGSTVAGCTDQNEEDEATGIVEINGRTIEKEEFVDTMESMYGEEVLHTLIMYEIVMSAAEEEGVEATEEDIDEEIGQIRDDLGAQGYSQFLAQYGMNEASFRYNLAISMAIDNIRYSEVEVTEEALYDHFSENRDQFDHRDEVRASHILVSDESSAWHMIELLEEGDDFAELAKMYSEDPGTAEDGGDLGYFGRNEMDPAFEEAAFATSVGEISDPVESYAGYHVIKVVDRKEGRPAEFEEVEDLVEESYKEENARSGQEVLEDIRSEADVEILESEYSGIWSE
ncbi:MAG: peptidylprolyl isomerase [Bacillota bacterium]